MSGFRWSRRALGAGIVLVLVPAFAQSPSPATTQAEPPSGGGQVLFSRSSDSPESKAGAQALAPAALAASVTDPMREAPQWTSYDFTIHLDPGASSMETLVRATVRNSGSSPMTVLPMQLGGSLHFDEMRGNGHELPFATHVLQSDADHTGQLTEAAVKLPQPLAPGAQIALVIGYGGTIPASTGRLDRLDTPSALAAATDWDQIGPQFTGLRGFGDSVWYPVSSVPAMLGEGAKLFEEIGRQKQRGSGTPVRMVVTVSFTGAPPNLAVFDGQQVPVDKPATQPTVDYPGVLQLTLPPTTLGFRTPSLLIATRQNAAANQQVAVAALPAHAAAGPNYATAATALQPLFAEWFGRDPEQPLLLVDLPVGKGARSEDGDALLLSLTKSATPQEIAGDLAAPLAYEYFSSPRNWLQEGVYGLMNLLWIEHTQGRDAAVTSLGNGYGSLALAEPGTPGMTVGQPLNEARDAVFYREKATAVLWMLRMMIGDTALSQTLRAYDPAKDTDAGYFPGLVAEAVKRQGASALPGSDSLGWFFHDWVDNDPGLPDLAIADVFSHKTGAGEQYLVSVHVTNDGYAAAWVPITVRSASTSTTEYALVPARGDLSRRILLNGEPTEVDVNDGSVPEVQSNVHRRTIQ